jgi:multiple antibiotic resistance protein
MAIFTDTFMYGFASLFAVINPIGMSAVYLSMTRDLSEAVRQKGAYQVAMFGGGLLLVTFFLGPWILKFFGISIASMQVAGGILVFFSAWKAFDAKPRSLDEATSDKPGREDVIFFPIAMPLTVGAGAIAVVIALSSKLQIAGTYTVSSVLASLFSIVVVMALVALCYRWAQPIFARLGQNGMNVVSRLSAFLLLCIGVSIVWQGILGLLQSMPHS